MLIRNRYVATLWNGDKFYILELVLRIMSAVVSVHLYLGSHSSAEQSGWQAPAQYLS